MFNYIINLLFLLEVLSPVYTSNELERQAFVIAVVVEAGSGSIREKEVVMHVILNHANLPSDHKSYWTIIDALGSASLADGVLGNASIEDTYNYLACQIYDEGNPHCQTYWIENYFNPTVEFVNNFLENPTEDFINGDFISVDIRGYS